MPKAQTLNSEHQNSSKPYLRPIQKTQQPEAKSKSQQGTSSLRFHVCPSPSARILGLAGIQNKTEEPQPNSTSRMLKGEGERERVRERARQTEREAKRGGTEGQRGGREIKISIHLSIYFLSIFLSTFVSKSLCEHAYTYIGKQT